ncbi:MAG: hypothetical protein AB7U27_09355 [Aminobacteriaceae bacterium]|nr:hypothetical protein [Synergistales bacterium]
MDYGSLLLLFDEENPCWTEKLVQLTGEDPALLADIVRDGLAERKGEICVLTGEGREAFRKEAAESYLSAEPGIPGLDLGKHLFRTRLRLLLDRKHIQRWGLKEYVPGACFSVPDLEDALLFSLDGRLDWKWPSSPAVERMRIDWPVTGLAARRIASPPADASARWFENLGEVPAVFETDLLYLSRYDFQAYTSFDPLPGDRWGLLNADRFFCMDSPSPETVSLEWFLGTVGRFQLALEVLRRMVLPGFMDLDSHDQDGINWLVFLFETEKEAERCVSLLAHFGQDLIRPAIPMDVWALSFEALEAFSEKAETIHDLLPVIGKAVVRTP